MKPFSIDYVEPKEGPEGVVDVFVSGFLDAHTVVTFESALNDLLERKYQKFIIDLEGLSYISSAGIGALMVLLQQLRRRQGDMVLFQPSPKVFKLLELLGFNKVFTIVHQREDAVAKLG